MLSHDAKLLLLGAAIALFSSIVTIFIKDWVSARRKRIERKEEKKEKQEELHKAFMQDLQAKGYVINPKVASLQIDKNPPSKSKSDG